MVAPLLRRFLGMAEPDVLPPPGTYREFDVLEAGSNIGLTGSTDSFTRDRRSLTAPQSYFRCTALAVRNLSGATITVKMPGRPAAIVPPGVTDIINSGNTFIDTYTITASAAVTAGDLLVVERCRSWQGWTPNAQDLG